MMRMKKSFLYGITLAAVFVGFSMMAGEAFSAPEKTNQMAKKAKRGKLEAKAEGFEEVDLFAAIAEGKLDAGVIQKGMKDGMLFIENKSDKPLSVSVPQTFGTRPILGQNTFNQRTNNQNQQLFGSGGQNGMMGGGGRGMFNIPPEKVISMPYESLCLEYGKPVPTSASNYEIVSMDEVTDKEEVKQLCLLIGTVDHSALQFAAWHMNSGTSVEKLAAETILRAGRRIPYFSQQQIQIGLAAVQRSKLMAQQVSSAEAAKASVASPGEAQN